MMQPVQEAKQELEAAIRYAENAISAAQTTIESMSKYQEQTGREEALQREVDELKAQVNALEQPERPTMPVIPKAVAIAIFREGMKAGKFKASDSIIRLLKGLCERKGFMCRIHGIDDAD